MTHSSLLNTDGIMEVPNCTNPRGSVPRYSLALAIIVLLVSIFITSALLLIPTRSSNFSNGTYLKSTGG